MRLLLLLLLAAPAFAQEDMQTRLLSDPIDGTQFEHPLLLGTNGLGGFDSDGCTYARGEQPRAYAIATSPTSLYSAPVEQFARELTQEQKDALLPVLSGLGADVDDARRLGTVPRYELAVATARVLGAPPYELGELYLTAAWTVRDTIVGFLPGLKGAGHTWQQIVELTPEAARVEDKPTRVMALFDLARVAHRGGLPVERGDFLTLLARMEAPPPQTRERHAAFLARVAEEDRLLLLARQQFEQGLTRGDGTPQERAWFRYLVGDLSRRLGDWSTATTQLEAVSLDRAAAPEVKKAVDDILRVLRLQARAATVPPVAPTPAPAPQVR